MRLGIFCYYNKAFKCFTSNFTLDDHEDKKVVFNVSREVSAKMVLGTYKDLKYLVLYRLGYFDDETGEFIADKTLLLDLDDMIASFECKKENIENERKEESK